MKNSYEAFHKFIETSDSFNEEEKKNILEYTKEGKGKKVLTMVFILLGWSVVMAPIDIFLIPGALSAEAIFTGHVTLLSIGPSLLFLFGNAIAKYFYVRKSLGKIVGVSSYVKSTIPYFGSVLLLSDCLHREPATRRALGAFLKDKESRELAKKRVVERFCSLFRCRT